MADLRRCAVCDILVTEDVEIAVRARKNGIRLAHDECAVLYESGMFRRFGELVAEAGFDRCRHRAGTVGGRCLDCGATNA